MHTQHTFVQADLAVFRSARESILTVSPAGGGLRGWTIIVTMMFICYRLEAVFPPPSLRDTSAGGGQYMRGITNKGVVQNSLDVN